MENRFRLRFSRMFRSSFSSCGSRNISDVIQNQNNFQMIEPLPPKPRPLTSICRHRCPETIINNSCCIDSTTPRRKVSEQYSPFAFTTTSNGRMCPPASPISPLNSTYYECKVRKKDRSVKNKRKKRTRLRKTKTRENASFTFTSSSQESFKAWSWFSSDDDDDDEKEDETETLFSSKSLSSDSSEMSLRQHRSRRNKNGIRRRSRAARKGTGSDVLPLSIGKYKVKDSFAVVKSSSDPYTDFRTSMVEMIVEKQIFAAKDLEQLLQCFLSLNSHHHHKIIVEVFMEIWEALFSNWS